MNRNDQTKRGASRGRHSANKPSARNQYKRPTRRATSARSRSHAKAQKTAPKAAPSVMSQGNLSSETKPSLAESVRDFAVSRRNFLLGGAGAIAAIGAGAGIVSFANASARADLDVMQSIAGDAAGKASEVGDLSVLNVANDQIFTTENCTYIEDAAEVVTQYAKTSLPYGSLVWATDSSVAACLLPTDVASPLTQVGLLSLSSGKYEIAINGAVGESEGFQIYDVRANSSVVLWTESNITAGTWRIYQAQVDGLTAKSPVLLFEGDRYWQMPDLVVCGNYSFWQLIPNNDSVAPPDGSSEISVSRIMRASLNTDTPEIVYEAKGSAACSPTASTSGIAFVMRANASGTYYQLTYMDAESATVTDSLVLPSYMKPNEVAYGTNGFSFSFDAIYSYGGGISNLGTYTPANAPTLNVSQATSDALAAVRDKVEADGRDADKVITPEVLDEAEFRGIEAVADLYSNAEWFRFPRIPFTDPAWCKDWFIVKSTSVVAGVNFAQKSYFTISSEGTGESYGEFLASTGVCDKFVTYANLDYTPLNGDHIKECAVRIWGI